MDPLWSETCWSTFKYFIIWIVSAYYILCISWIIKCSSQRVSSRLRLKCDSTRAETRFRLSAKGTSPFKSAGASVQSTPGTRGCVKSTGYPLHSPVSPSLPLPCVTVCHHISTVFSLSFKRRAFVRVLLFSLQHFVIAVFTFVTRMCCNAICWFSCGL